MKAGVEMTPKEHLSQVKRIHDLIEDIKSEIKMLKIQRDGLTGMSYDKELVQTSLTDTGLENQIILIEQKQSRLAELERDYDRIREDVRKRIDRIQLETERNVLEYRYLRFLEWSDICNVMQKTQDSVYSLHKRALQHYIC